jgi:hypothetical protein
MQPCRDLLVRKALSDQHEHVSLPGGDLLDGQMLVRCGDEVWVALPGEWVPFPRGVPHTFRVMGGPARVLMVHDNDSFMAFVRDLGQPAVNGGLPAPTGGPGFEALDRAAAAHDITTVGPSMEPEEAQAILGAPPDDAVGGILGGV